MWSTHLCANFSALAGASGTVGSFSARCLQVPSEDGGEQEELPPQEPKRTEIGSDRIGSRAGVLLEGRDGIEEEVDPLDLDRGGLARVVGGEPIGDGAGAVGALHRRLQQRERHRWRRALHGTLSSRQLSRVLRRPLEAIFDRVSWDLRLKGRKRKTNRSAAARHSSF